MAGLGLARWRWARNAHGAYVFHTRASLTCRPAHKATSAASSLPVTCPPSLARPCASERSHQLPSAAHGRMTRLSRESAPPPSPEPDPAARAAPMEFEVLPELSLRSDCLEFVIGEPYQSTASPG